AANARDGRIIKGPLKVFDTTPALIGGLYAEREGRLVAYSRKVFELFFRRELAVDEMEAMAKFMPTVGLSEQGYRDYAGGEGAKEYARAQEEAAANCIFGVPMLLFRGEPFWGNDRLPMLERCLQGAGLAIAHAPREVPAGPSA